MGIPVAVSVSGTPTDVTGDANGNVNVRLKDSTGADLAVANAGTVSSTTRGLPMILADDGVNAILARGDRMGNIGIAYGTPMFHEPVESTTFHSVRWTAAATTFTLAQTAVGINLNSGAVTTINAVQNITSSRQFLKVARQPLHGHFRLNHNLVTNSTADWGFGAPSGTSAIANGAFWRFGSDGTVKPFIAFNGSENRSGSDVVASLNTIDAAWKTRYWSYDIIIDDDQAIFIVQDSNTGLIVSRQTLTMDLASARLLAVSHLPVFARVYNGGSAPASAPVFIVTDVMVQALDMNLNKAWSHVVAGMQLGGAWLPTTAAQSANYTNSAAPTSATLSNTAAGYTTLGGQFQWAAVAGAETDYALFGFTVPSPYSFYCQGITIDLINTGAANAATPTTCSWAVGVNSSAINLSTATLSRVPVGISGIAASAVIGQLGTNSINVQFPSPLVTDQGRLLILIMKCISGAATASQVIRGVCGINGYYE